MMLSWSSRCCALLLAALLPTVAWTATPSADEAKGLAPEVRVQASAGQQGSPQGPQSDWSSRLDALVQQGWDEPDRALAALAQLPATAETRRAIALATGLVQAGVRRSVAAEESARVLDGLAANEPVAGADAALVRAQLADSEGAGARARAAALLAQQGYEKACPADPGCDYRSSWRMLWLLGRNVDRTGQNNAARDLALAAAEVARAAGDINRQAQSLARAADLSAQQGDSTSEQRFASQAWRLAKLEGSPLLLSRMRLMDTLLLSRRGDVDGPRRAAQAGLALALQAGSQRQAAVHLANLSDIEVKSGRPRQALQAVQQALPIVQRLGSLRTERVLMHNAALARLALGEPELARRTLDELLAAHHADGALADEAEALREFSDAFAKAGDLRTALDLYHKERALAAQIMVANRDATLAQLRARNDKEAQQRQLEQLALENSLVSAQLDNRAMLHKLWLAVAVVLALVGALVVVLYKRVREINRRLASNHAVLRAQSQRDPLTNLANRRGLLETAVAHDVDKAFKGALLLVDIDHFKHVNDGHGHAAGDAVLVEVAQRLSRVVRDNDLVARWGGEEFLIYMPGVAAPQAQALAERVLQAVGGEPVWLGAAADSIKPSLRITVSVGFGCFPLPPARLPLTLERAINLADMALYSAKGQGRNRAVGLAAVRGDDDASLRQIESDFEQAWHEGRVTLLRTPGPGSHSAAATRPAALV